MWRVPHRSGNGYWEFVLDGVNSHIKTFVDAFYYGATCASVGYVDIFALTQTGRAIAALVMILGPGLTAYFLGRSRPLDVVRLA